MKVSIKWLSQYVDISGLSPEVIADRLTFAGVEVESIHHLASGTNLVIGHVLKAAKMPESDHLSVLSVDEGPKYGIVQIVCGAPNVAAGQKVIVSRPGAELAKGKITKSVIKGYESDGMVCSLLELGVESKYLSEAQINGIEVLPAAAEVGGEKVLEYLGLDDTTLDLKLLANRSDCLAMINVAKEVGALFDRPVTLPKVMGTRGRVGDVHIANLTEKCPQFSIKVLNGITVGPSPEWLRQTLVAMGVRSINNLVDIGNYIMLLTGQPLHMYDLDKMPNHDFVVRSDYEGDFVALDSKTYHVQKGDIVIMSGGEVMCLGGVMGGLSSAISEQTHNVAIEAACFDQASIRRTMIRLNLVSESSQRFAKGINAQQYEYVLDMTAKLVKTLCDAKEQLTTVTIDNVGREIKIIHASAKRINGRLGTSFDNQEIFGALEKVGIRVTHIKGNRFRARIPNHRIDITGEADLSEEVIRLLGFEYVKSVLPRLDTTVGTLNDAQRKKRLIREYLLGRGVSETINYTLVRKAEIHDYQYINQDETYTLLHPMTDDHEVIRRNVLPSLLDTVTFNVARQNKDLALFELSEMFTKGGTETHLAIVLTGEKQLRHQMAKRNYSYYDAKGLFEGIMAVLGVEPTRYKLERLVSPKEEFHPGRSALIKSGKEIVGVLGELHPKALKKYDIGKTVTVAVELKLSSFIALRNNNIKMVAPARYPSVERDLAFLVKKEVAASEIVKAVRIAGHEIIKKVEVFDHYEGPTIAPELKSLAIKITYQDDNKTLIDNEITTAEEHIKQELYRAFGVTIRS